MVALGQSLNAKPLLYLVTPASELLYNLINPNLGAKFGENQRPTFGRSPNGLSSCQKLPLLSRDEEEVKISLFLWIDRHT